MRSILVFLLLTLPCALNAQLVRGRVLEAEGDQPIHLATLELLDDRGRVLAETLSDSTGAFRIRAWQAGKYRLRAGGLGYETVTSELMELATGGEFVLEVRLAVDAIPLEPITVVARSQSSLKEIALRGYYDRRDFGRRIGLGRYYDRGEIEEMGTRLTDVLRRVPGLRVIEGRAGGNETIVVSGNLYVNLREGRPCQANIYLDGLLIRKAFETRAEIPLADIDQFVPLEWVEAIEVYRRASEVPAEFLSRANCGVVAIWTRHG